MNIFQFVLDHIWAFSMFGGALVIKVLIDCLRADLKERRAKDEPKSPPAVRPEPLYRAPNGEGWVEEALVSTEAREWSRRTGCTVESRKP